MAKSFRKQSSPSITAPSTSTSGSLRGMPPRSTLGAIPIQRFLHDSNRPLLTPAVVQRLQQQYGNRLVSHWMERAIAPPSSLESPIQRRYRYVGDALAKDVAMPDEDIDTDAIGIDVEPAAAPQDPLHDIWKDDAGYKYHLDNAIVRTGGIELTFKSIGSAIPPQVFTVPAQIGTKQYSGFAPDGIHYQDPATPAQIFNLQDLNQVTGYVDIPFAPNAKSAFAPLAEEDYKSEFHRTAFLGRVSLIPINSSRGNELFRSDEIWVDGVKIPDERPPTKFGKEGQRSHTVAWTLLRTGLQNLQGQPLSKFFKILNKMFTDVKIPEFDEAADAAQALKNRILTGIGQTQNVKKVAEIFYWQRLASDFIGQYVHLYQLSKSATYADGRAIGHGESGSMEMLRLAENELKQGNALSATALDNYAESAVGLLDIKSRLSDKNIANIYHHWVNLLHLAFPYLMRTHHNDIIRKLGLPGARLTDLTTAFGKDPTQPMSTIFKKPVGHSRENSATMADTAITKAHQSTFTANVFLVPQKSVAKLNVGVEEKNAGVVMNTTQLSLGHYTAADLKIEAVEVADDRPNTRFGNLQRSHTVAWTFIRRHLISFGGKSAATLLNFIAGELPGLHNDIPPPGKKILYDAPAEAARLHANLTQLSGNADGFPIHQWQTRLSELVESYITLYQLSGSATYSKEERPAPHGEGQAILDLETLESEAAAIPDMATRTAFITSHTTQIYLKARKLVDAVVATSSLNPHNWQTAIEHWIKLLAGKYPLLMSVPEVVESVRNKASVAEPKDEYLVGYKAKSRFAGFSDHEKLLINLYEEAVRDVRIAPATFNKDLQSILQRGLSNLDAPKHKDWELLIYGTSLTDATLRKYQSALQAYQSRDGGRRSSTHKELPNQATFSTLISDVTKYMAVLKGDKAKIVGILLQDIRRRSTNVKIDAAVQTFVSKNVNAIQAKLESAFDDALEVSVASDLHKIQNWFNIITAIKPTETINYANLTRAIQAQAGR